METLRCVVVGTVPVAGDVEGVQFRSTGSACGLEAAALMWDADAVAADLQALGANEVRRLAVRYPHVPVVAVAPQERVAEAVRAGAAGVVVPPADGHALAEEVRRVVAHHRRVQEAARREVLQPLLRLRELAAADGNPETVLRRLAEIARVTVSADRAAAVTLCPAAAELVVGLAEVRGVHTAEGFWTVVPGRLASVPAGAEADDGRTATVALVSAGRPVGALTVLRHPHREPFGPAERELLDVLAVVASLPLVQLDLLHRLREGNRRLTEALAYACELHEASLRGHSERLASYAVAIGRRLGLSEVQLADLRVAGMLHDVGKIGISDTLLLKAGPLTPEEYETVKRHAVMGAEILSAAGFGEDVVRWVLHHHERWDGRGYPMGLAGEEIPLGARILAVADAYEVMTTGRSYRAPVLPGQALEELRRQRGAQFDPQVVDAFAEALSSGEVVAEAGWSTGEGWR
ncbi:MAG: HD-GYP domain-containing protein [Armatimonadota bacterium]|nr:HD-GYP domain-containing protein [Armatimonadota bacterium]MDW8155968.1 HD-GYP domain-containing protein [Armatimonadota bacterium]